MSDGNEIQRSLGRIEGTLDSLKEIVEGQATKMGEITTSLRTVDARVTGLETKAGMIGAGAGAGVALVWGLIKSKLGIGEN